MLEQILSVPVSDGSRHRRRKQQGGVRVCARVTECVCLCVLACKHTQPRRRVLQCGARRRDKRRVEGMGR